MKHNIEFKHFEPREHVRKLIEELISRLEKHLKDFNQDVVFFRLLVEENPVRTLYHVSVTLDVPGKTIAAKEERHDVRETLRDAFAEIERQLDKHKGSLRREHLWKRIARREQIRREKKVEPVPPEERNRELFVGLMNQHLDKLYNFVRRELAYHHDRGELVLDDPSAEDIVDATVLRACDEFAKSQGALEVVPWLMRLAIEYIESEIKRTREERENLVHFDEVLPEVALTKRDRTPDDEDRDSCLSDVDLNLEGIFPGIALPHDENERRAMRHEARDSLLSLPAAWRRAFVLQYVEQLSITEIAHVTDLSEAQVTRHIESARAQLRQRLLESGFGLGQGAESGANSGARKATMK